MHIALDCGEQNLAFVLLFFQRPQQLLGFDERNQVRHGPLHHARTLDDLRQKHLAGAKQIADDVHAVHQRPFDHMDGPLDGEPSLLGVFENEVSHTMHECIGETFTHRQLAPRKRRGRNRRGTLHIGGHFEQSLGGIGATVEHQVFHAFEQRRRNIGVERERTGIHDAHIHAGIHGVVEEHGVDRFAQRVIAAEGEADVTHSAADASVWQRGLDFARGIDEVHGVIRMFFDAGTDRENVRIEDDVFRRKADTLGEQRVGTRTD